MQTRPRSLLALFRVVLLVSAVLVVPPAWAWNVTVAWDPNPPSENVTGYVLHYGKTSRTASGFTAYSSQVNVGNVTQHSLALPDDGGTYYLAVVAYNGAGLQSHYSSEVLATPPAPTPYSTDTTPPSVTISSPADGSTISKVVRIRVNAAGTEPIERIEAFAGDKQLGSLNCRGASTCSGSISWNTNKGVALGTHTITAHAHDVAANRGTSAVRVYKNR
ncbi:MAG: Ig-like domain-containing protein [Deferrisomatales bacterium]|nr:Ig-like domain-containing protein [Deferrisomatales bacterium]